MKIIKKGVDKFNPLIYNRDKEYNLDAEINVVVDGFDRPFTICFGSSEGVTKANCETVDLMVGDIGEEAV